MGWPLGLKGAGKVGAEAFGPSLCYRPALSWLGADRGRSQRMPLVARVPPFRPAFDCGGLLAVLRDRRRLLGW